jgi:hypothetical protein
LQLARLLKQLPPMQLARVVLESHVLKAYVAPTMDSVALVSSIAVWAVRMICLTVYARRMT